MIYIHTRTQAMQERASRARKPTAEAPWHVQVDTDAMLRAAAAVRARAPRELPPLLPEPAAAAAMLRRVFASEFPEVDPATVFVAAGSA